MTKSIIKPWQIIEMRWAESWLSKENAFEGMDLKKVHRLTKDDIRELLLKIKQLEAERELALYNLELRKD